MGPPEFHIYGAYPRKADMDLTDHHTGAYHTSGSCYHKRCNAGSPSMRVDLAFRRALCVSLGFVVKGPTPDQYKALSRYRVLLAPLRVGAGVKGKIADAWWCVLTDAAPLLDLLT